MDKTQSYPIILEELKKKFSGQKTEEELRSLAESVSGTIVYATDLKDLNEDFLREAIELLEKPVYTAAMETIRNYFKEGLTKTDRAKRDTEQKEATLHANWRYFIECWDTFKKEGDLRNVMPIKIGFLASWLKENPKMVNEEELEWCRNRTQADFEKDKFKEIKLNHNEYLNEVIVLLVMKKLSNSQKEDPEKVSSFIESKRTACNGWYIHKYGTAPDWGSQNNYRRNYVKKFI